MLGSFFGTNVLLYIASGDLAKSEWGEKLMGAGCTISMQVLNEIASVLPTELSGCYRRGLKCEEQD